MNASEHMTVEKHRPYGSLAKKRGIAARKIRAETHGRGIARECRLQEVRALASQPEGLRDYLEKHAFDELSRSSTMLATLPDARQGGDSPGPNGIRWNDLGHRQWADECGKIQEEVRSCEFNWKKPRPHDIPKPDGGHRRIGMPDVQVRLQQRVLLDAAHAAFDSRFTPNSWGNRPERGRHLAMACIQAHLVRRPCSYVLTADIRQAFDHVPIGRLRELLKRWFVDPRLVEWALCLTRATKNGGIGQGGPLSPFLLNVLLHDALDRRWPGIYGHIVVHRYADDLLILGESEDKVAHRFAEISKYLSEVGMEVKNPEAKPRPVTEWTEWLGYRFRNAGEGVVFQVDEGAWAALEEALRKNYQETRRGRRGRAVVFGWIGQYGAVVSEQETPQLYGKLASTLETCGFEGELSQSKLLARCHKARKAFRKLCEAETKTWDVASA